MKTAFAFDESGNLAMSARLWENPISGQHDRWVVSESLFDSSDRVIETREVVYEDSGDDGELAWQVDADGKPVVLEPEYRAPRMISKLVRLRRMVEWMKISTKVEPISTTTIVGRPLKQLTRTARHANGLRCSGPNDPRNRPIQTWPI